jgi:hypothetical protein
MSTDDTAASEHGADAETTAVPPPPADAPELAWSVDDDTDESQPNRHGRLIWTGLSVLVFAVTAALVLLVSTLFGRHHSDATKHQPTAPVPTAQPTTTVAAPAPTVTTTVAPPPPTVTVTRTPAPVLSDEDHRLLHNLRAADGYEVDNPTLVVEHAHRYCALVQQGFSGYQAWQTVVSESHNEVGMHISIPRPLMGAARTPTEMAWNILTAEALTVYPNCRD